MEDLVKLVELYASAVDYWKRHDRTMALSTSTKASTLLDQLVSQATSVGGIVRKNRPTIRQEINRISSDLEKLERCRAFWANVLKGIKK